MTTDKERLAILETNVSYIRESVDRIHIKVDDLMSFRFKVIGGASVMAAIVSYVVAVLCS